MSRGQILQDDLDCLTQQIAEARIQYEKSKTRQAAEEVNVLIGKAKTILLEMASLEKSA